MILTLILVFIAAIANACMDTIWNHYDNSIFAKLPYQNWLNPKISYVNKWKPKSKIGDLIMSTALVWITDFWHNLKFIMLVCLSFAISINLPIINVYLGAFIYYCVFTCTFELFWSKLLIVKRK